MKEEKSCINCWNKMCVKRGIDFTATTCDGSLWQPKVVKSDLIPEGKESFEEKRNKLMGTDFGYLEHGEYDDTYLMKGCDVLKLEKLVRADAIAKRDREIVEKIEKWNIDTGGYIKIRKDQFYNLMIQEGK